MSGKYFYIVVPEIQLSESHTTKEAAIAEAKSLAQENGTERYVYEVRLVGVAQQTVRFEEVSE